MSSKIKHLQGVRGLAIFAVILFHFIPWDFPNGYLGVDIFFVLSGYLMPMILSKEQNFNLYTITDFWYRRIKRIFPLYYSILLLITGSLFFFTVPNLPLVLDSLINSILFCTNLQTFNGYDYFIKLSAFFDLYTHTWSLCVEIQFYLLFPLLYYLNFTVPLKYSEYNIPWYIATCSSLLFYLTSSEYVAFNCVLSRLWQFAIGIITFYNGKLQKKKESGDSLVSLLSLTIICLTMFTKFEMSKNYARLIITAVTSLLISHGSGNALLESRVAVFAGEISYAWYLVHWPIACYQKKFGLSLIYHYPAFMVLSFGLAVLIYFFFEKQYLKWNHFVIFLSIFLFAMGNVAMFVPLSNVTPRDIQRVRALSRNYSSLTRDEVIKFNTDLFNLDVPLLIPENCSYPESPSLKWQGFCEFEEPYPRNGNNTLMIIGNSWAANVLRLVHEECTPYAKNISFYSVGGCDVLPDLINSCKIKPEFVESVEKMRPDVLLIISRAIDLKHVDDGMLPLEDSVYASAVKRLQELETLVRKKIFILNAFHNINRKITEKTNEYLQYGELNPTELSLDPPNGLKVARMRTEELVRNCKKCELFDYVPWLSINHRVTLYDPKNFVTFANSVSHFTLPGQEKLRPLYREICTRLPSF